MLSVSSFLPGPAGQPILGLEYSGGEQKKECGEVRLTAHYVKARWRCQGEARRSSFILHIRPEIINEALTPQAAGEQTTKQNKTQEKKEKEKMWGESQQA